MLPSISFNGLQSLTLLLPSPTQEPIADTFQGHPE